MIMAKKMLLSGPWNRLSTPSSQINCSFEHLSRNQVWITQPIAADYMNRKSNKFVVMRSSYNTGFDHFLETQCLDRATMQISWLKAPHGSNEKVCEKQVEEIWNELNDMGL